MMWCNITWLWDCKMNHVMLDFVVSCWHYCLPVYCRSSSSTRRKTYESLCQSISLLYCLSCWVSVSHVRALAVKTSVDEVSADTVPLLNQWPLKVWEQARLSHEVQARSEPRVTDVLSSVLETPSDGCGGGALPKLTSTPGFTTKPTVAICHQHPSQKWK